MIRVGPAGWSYPDWEGVVYPRDKPAGFHPLRFLARFVDCLEINSSFYSPPSPPSAAGWARIATERPDFRLVAKLHRDFTHRDRARDEGDLDARAQRFLEGIEPLRRGGRLAALLVQFPISFHHGAAQVRWLGILRELFGGVPLVLEVRHASWFEPRPLAAVGGLGYSLAHLDLPPAWNHPPPWHGPTGPIGYLRLHGRNGAAWFRSRAGRDERYDYLYGPGEIQELAQRARRLAGEHDQTYVVTNNHFSGKAVANALEILAELRGAPVPAPPDLVRAFPRLAGSTRVEGQRELF